MKHHPEISSEIHSLAAQLGRPVRIMEVCGTHTMSAFRTGLRSILPDSVTLLSGPGCPVCVTTVDYIDQSIAIANLPDTIVTTFGDMIRVPGSESSLEKAKARGADVRILYSPMDATKLAQENPDKNVVFLGVGFETTTPTVAWTIKQASELKLENYFVLCAHKVIPPAMEALLSSGDIQIDGFMCPGHVSVVIGADAYKFAAKTYGVPCVVAGFEADDMAECILMTLRQLCEGRAEVEIEYKRSVDSKGNAKAQDLIASVLEPCDAAWRGIGTIPGSGLRIRPEYKQIDAIQLLEGVELPEVREPKGCACGEILKGTKQPPECPLFGTVCTPDSPVGACMVSSEGSCAAHYKYGKHN